jgi:hypothetical protein
MPSNRVPHLAALLALLLAGCQGVGGPAGGISPVRSDTRVIGSWNGRSTQGDGCPALLFALMMHEDGRVAGWVQEATNRDRLQEISGIVDQDKAILAVGSSLWTGVKADDQIALVEPAGCRRRIVMSRS